MVATATTSELSARQSAIGKRLDQLAQAGELRTAMQKAIDVWLTMEPHCDVRERPLRPFPIDRREQANDEVEDTVLLAAAYQAYCPTANPIRPAVFNLDDLNGTRWYRLVKATSRICGDDLGYLDGLISKTSERYPARPPRQTRSGKRSPRLVTIEKLERQLIALMKDEKNRRTTCERGGREPEPMKPIIQKDLVAMIKSNPSNVSRAFSDKQQGAGIQRLLDGLNKMREA